MNRPNYRDNADKSANPRPNGQQNRRPRYPQKNNNGSNNRNNNNNANRSVSSLRHQTFDSNGPDVRVRGNAAQVFEKYQALARDARTSGDRVMAENYLQHAEHYYRINEAIKEAMGEKVVPRQDSAPNAVPPNGNGNPRAEQRTEQRTEQKIEQPKTENKGEGEQPAMPENYFSPEGKLVADETSKPAPAPIPAVVVKPEPGQAPVAKVTGEPEAAKRKPRPAAKAKEADAKESATAPKTVKPRAKKADPFDGGDEGSSPTKLVANQ